MSDITDHYHYDEMGDRLTVSRTQDVEPYLDHNKRLRDASPEHGAYMGRDMVHAASIPFVVVEMMRNGQCCTDGKKYDLLSPDNDERRRALMHVQSEHKHLLTIRGKPFAKNRVKWQ